MEQAEPPVIEFGVKWEPRIQLVKVAECSRCGFDFIAGCPENPGYYSFDRIVGFSTVLPEESYRDDTIGVAIYSCPKCQTQVCWHMDVENLWHMLDGLKLGLLPRLSKVVPVGIIEELKALANYP